jgi:thiamine-phosphate pyrophosphorylase
MMSDEECTNKLERLIDANLNRLKEGIRVIEDINRYIYDNASLASSLKSLRHKFQSAYDQDRLRHRDIENDVQKESVPSELVRHNINDLTIANFSRAEESARVLEESFKLIDPLHSKLFKEIRYTLYALEKEFFIQNNAK